MVRLLVFRIFGCYTWQTVVSGFEPTGRCRWRWIGSAVDRDQPGRILVIENGSLRADPYLDIIDRVGSTEGMNRGFSGLALHPKYLENGFFYVNYTNKSGNTVIARFTANLAKRRSRADSEKILLQVRPTLQQS